MSTLRNSIDSLVLALHKIQLGPENAKVNVIENVRDTLIGLTTIIDALEADEVSTMQHALHEQAVVFTDILSDFMQDSMHLLDDQKRELGTNLKERELKFVEQVEHQQLEFTQTLAAKLTEQEKKLNSTWRATVKERVDQERAGRLAKLDMLAIKMQQIENASSQAGIYILRAHRIHSLMTNIAAFQRSLTVGAKTDYSHELQVVQKIAVDDAFVQFLLDTVSPVGVVSKGALIGEFNGLEPEIRKVQLMPDQAGPISYFLSKWLSYLFIPKSGLVAGQDVESTISRAKYYLMNSDLDSAAREINQLDGWCGFIVREWLVKARKHLEVEQALDAIETHVHLQSLGMAK